MRRILAVSVALLVPAVAYAQTLDPPITGPAPQRYGTAEHKTEIRVLPPLKLPNITLQVRRLQAADRSVVQKQLAASERVLRFWAGKHAWLLAKRHHKCSDVAWQRSCTVARASYRLHEKLAQTAEDRLVHEIPLINDWRTAVHWVQKIYPGTEQWMLYISDREGGWGKPVWYSGMCSSPPCHWTGVHLGNDYLGMDAVFGPMQFRYSTFSPWWKIAQTNLRERGYVIPDIPMPSEGGNLKYAAWISPLGQALTAGFMKYYGKQGCNWCL